MLGAQHAFSQTYLITTVAGGGLPGTPSPATSASFQNPHAVAADTAGNSYFIANDCVFKVDGAGTLTRVAGSQTRFGYTGDGGNATAAMLSHPSGVAVDAAGNLFIADTGNNVIRKVTNAGIITTVAGNGTAGFAGDGGPGPSAELNSPGGLAVDTAGNVYVADSNNQRIREIATNGYISTVVGNGGSGYSGDGGPATAATLSEPLTVAVDGAQNLYIGDTFNYRVRRVSNSGIITTIAGNGIGGFSGDNGPATSAEVDLLNGIAADSAGNLYVADEVNNRIRKISTMGIITTVVGNGVAGFSGDGGPATSAELSVPQGVAVDGNGNLFIADEVNWRIRKVSSGGVITTIAGSGLPGYTGDGGPATSAQMTPGYGVAAGAGGVFYVSDIASHVVRKIAANGTITTYAGTGQAGYSGDNGLATSAQLHSPAGLALDSNGNLYIADSANNVIRKVAVNGTITTAAGNGQAGYSGDSGPPTSAELKSPYGVALDSSGNLYIADTVNNVIRKVATNNTISTVAGNGMAGQIGDGGQATSAELYSPFSVAIDSAGNILIADSLNGKLRKVATNGIISTLVSTVIFYGVAVDNAGNAYISMAGAGVIDKVSSTGFVSTIGGFISGSSGYSGDNGPATSAVLNQPQGITVDASGHIYFADTGNYVVRELVPTGTNAVLSIAKTHTGRFSAPFTGATYTVLVSNATGAGATSGTVTVTENPPAAFTLASLSGTGWNCSGNACTRSDALGAGASYPAITVGVNVSSNAPSSATNQVAVFGGGSSASSSNDVTGVVSSSNPSAPTLLSPANGATGVGPTPVLSWSAAAGASSYDLYFGTASTPPLLINTTQTSYTTPNLNVGTTYYWKVVAKNGVGSASSPIWSFTTSSSCSYALNPVNATAVASAGGGSVDVKAAGGCSWTGASNTSWLTVTGGASGAGNGTVTYSVAANPYTLARSGTLTIAGLTFTLTQDGNPTLQFIPVTPCRVVDTRRAGGPFGGPALMANSTREFDIPNSTCNIPASAAAYSLNVTVVPPGTLNFLSLWPTGQPRPGVSTLNSDGRVKANAAITPAGSSGGVNVFVTDPTQVIIDIDGYFVASGTPSALAFYPLTPCRVADTRKANGSLGGPSLASGQTRTFPVLSSTCNIPATAQAYSMNFTAVPHGTLNFITTWPAGQTKPVVSTLNAPTGTVTANAAIVPAGTNGDVSVYASDSTDLLMDINGYFAPPTGSGLSLYTVSPCRVLDTRKPAGSPAFSGTLPVNVTGSACSPPSTAQAFVLNATAVPQGSLGWVTLWPDGQPQPTASTLNAYDGAITSNMAIVPTTNGSIDAYARNSTYLILDLFAYFAP